MASKKDHIDRHSEDLGEFYTGDSGYAHSFGHFIRRVRKSQVVVAAAEDKYSHMPFYCDLTRNLLPEERTDGEETKIQEDAIWLQDHQYGGKPQTSRNVQLQVHI